MTIRTQIGSPLIIRRPTLARYDLKFLSQSILFSNLDLSSEPENLAYKGPAAFLPNEISVYLTHGGG
jgi:hypothetical protein